MIVQAEFPAGDALRVLQQFDHALLVVLRLGLHVFGMDSEGGVDVRVFLGEFACAVKICRVACHMDKCLGRLHVRVGVVGESFE